MPRDSPGASVVYGPVPTRFRRRLTEIFCEQLLSHACLPSRSAAVDTDVQNLRANHRMTTESLHTGATIHSAGGVHQPLSTHHSHRDTPRMLGKQAFIPRFHSTYYCYSNIFQGFSSEEAPWGDRDRSPRETSPVIRMSARSISFQVGAESSTVFHRRRFCERVIRCATDGAFEEPAA